LSNFYTSVNRYANQILYRGYDSNGNKIQERIKFKPRLYINSPDNAPSQYKSLYGQYLKPVDFSNMKEAKNFMLEHEDFWTICGTTNYIHQFITKKFPNDISFDYDKINVLTFDIEVASADGFPYPEKADDEIISIAAKTSNNGRYYVWGMGDYDLSKCDIKGTDIVYIKCKDEIDLLTKFLTWYQNPEHTPDILTGWNIEFFDIPYLINRITRVLGDDYAKLLSPWNLINERTVKKFNRDQQKYELVGVQQLDYIDLFKKLGYSYGTQESYSLDNIASVVLGEKKLSYEEHGSLHSLYLNDYQKFIDYNIKDVQLVDRINDKMDLIRLSLTMAYKGGVNYTDTFGTTAIWDSIIYRALHSQNIMVPPNKQKTRIPYPGGYVKDPVPGLYKHVASFDLNSLYPNLIVQYNISPETLVTDEKNVSGVEHYLNNNDLDKNKKYAQKIECIHHIFPKYACTANGTYYRKDKRGIIPEIIISYYDERKITKKLMLIAQTDYEKNPSAALETEINQLENKQMAIKILMNSLYGALGSPYFRYFDVRMAEAITLSGQLSIMWAERAINDEINKILETKKDYVIAIDTDSVYLELDPLVKKFKPKDPIKFLDDICRDHFEKVIDKSYEVLFNKMNGLENRMWMGREVIADKGIWTAKKRYILNVHNSEGVQYAEPKLKIMGIQAIQSSTPLVIREKLKESFKIIISGSESKTQKFIADTKSEFKKMEIEDIAFPRGISNLTSFKDKNTIYKKGTPIHARGSLLYNKLIKDSGLQKKYEYIQNGDKIKFIYLKKPNVLKENVVAFKDYLPPEFHLKNSVDYETQFSKVFIKPLEPILDAIGWSIEETATLDDLFG